MSYKFQLEQFEGPLDLLLQLIEEERLPISEIALAQVADQFLQHLRSIEERQPEELADFLVIAAKLVLLKSRTLLPVVIEDEDDGIDLEQQLKIYREYYEASKRINAMLLARRYSFARNASLKIQRVERSFRPPERLEMEDVGQLFRIVIKRLEPFVTLPEETLLRTIQLKEKLESIRERILAEVSTNFHTLLSDADSKVEIIVTFLALLELIKQHSVVAVQESIFSTIAIQSADALSDRDQEQERIEA